MVLVLVTCYDNVNTYSICTCTVPFFSKQFEVRKKIRIPPQLAIHCNYKAEGECGGRVVLMCMKTNVYLFFYQQCLPYSHFFCMFQ